MNREIRAGDQFTLMIEVNGPGGLYAELSRNCVLGRASDELLEAYATSGLAPPLPARGSGELEVVEEERSQEEPPVSEPAEGAGATTPATEPTI